jgi:hypothetical protein
MKEMPSMYKKLREYLIQNEGRNRTDVEGDIAVKFRITKDELKQAMEEMRVWGEPIEKTQRRIRLRL